MTAIELPSNALMATYPELVRPVRYDLCSERLIDVRVRRELVHSQFPSSHARFNQGHFAHPSNREAKTLRAVNHCCAKWRAAVRTKLCRRPPARHHASNAFVAMNVSIATGTPTTHRIRSRPVRSTFSLSQARTVARHCSQSSNLAAPWVLHSKIQGHNNSRSSTRPIILPKSLQYCVHSVCVSACANAGHCTFNRDADRQPIHRHYQVHECATMINGPAPPRSQPKQQKRWAREIYRMGPVVRTNETGVPRFACHTRSGRR